MIIWLGLTSLFCWLILPLFSFYLQRYFFLKIYSRYFRCWFFTKWVYLSFWWTRLNVIFLFLRLQFNKVILYHRTILKDLFIGVIMLLLKLSCPTPSVILLRVVLFFALSNWSLHLISIIIHRWRALRLTHSSFHLFNFSFVVFILFYFYYSWDSSFLLFYNYQLIRWITFSSTTPSVHIFQLYLLL